MKRILGALTLLALLAGCVTTAPTTAIHQPMSVRPEARAYIAPSNGAIRYQQV